MKKALAILAVIGLMAVVSNAAVYTYNVQQDTKVSSGSASNYGGSSDVRGAKGSWQESWLGDWSAAQRADIVAKTAGLTYGTDWTLKFYIAPNDWGMSGGWLFRPEVQTITNSNAWSEMQVNWTNAATGVAWDGGAYNTIGFIQNSTSVLGMDPTDGWGIASSPSNISWCGALLDSAIVTSFLTDANNRGFRMTDDQYYNDMVMMIDKWGSGAAGTPGSGRLVLEIVPEPASMALIVMGGVGLLLRKRR